MKRFADLRITGTKAEIRAFLLDPSILSGGWSRNVQRETEVNSIDSGDSYIMFISPDGRNDLPHASVCLCPDPDDTEGNSYLVINIVPTQLGELSKEEYDKLLDAFYKDNIRGKTRERDLRVERSSGTFSAEDLVKEEIISAGDLDKLRSFSEASLKYDGGKNPSDKRRWWEFIISSIVTSPELDTATLQSLLKEQEWDEDSARGLAADYDNLSRFCRYQAARFINP